MHARIDTRARVVKAIKEAMCMMVVVYKGDECISLLRCDAENYRNNTLPSKGKITISNVDAHCWWLLLCIGLWKNRFLYYGLI